MKHPKLEALLRADGVAMKLLGAVAAVGPAEAYIGAGFLRNRVWDNFYQDGRCYAEADIDVVYYNAVEISADADYVYEARLKQYAEKHDGPEYDWQVRNQARMHHFHGYDPFSSLEDGLMHWAETATTVSVRLKNGELDFTAPFGFDDLLGHILRITPTMKKHDPEGFQARLEKKQWLKRWPNLKVIP